MCIDKKESGGSLLEVLISLAIFSLVGIAVLLIFANSLHAVSSANAQTQLQQANQSALQWLQVSSNPISWNGVKITPTSSTYSTTNSQGTIEGIQGLLSRIPGNTILSIQVSSDAGNNTCPCSATVSTSWQGGYESQSTEIQY